MSLPCSFTYAWFLRVNFNTGWNCSCSGSTTRAMTLRGGVQELFDEYKPVQCHWWGTLLAKFQVYGEREYSRCRYFLLLNQKRIAGIFWEVFSTNCQWFIRPCSFWLETIVQQLFRCDNQLGEIYILLLILKISSVGLQLIQLCCKF